MARPRTVHRCRDCDAVTPRWAGRCPTCGAWNALIEETAAVAVTPPATGRFPGLEHEALAHRDPGAAAVPVSLADVDLAQSAPRPTGLEELDRVLGGGLVPGSVTLLGGEPGVGKSTLVLQVLAAMAAGGRRVLLVSGEESAQQVRLRAERLGSLAPTLRLLDTTDVAAIAAAIGDESPALVVVDSVQAVADPAVSGMPGSLAQVRACADLLVHVAKSLMVPMVLVGHVTKDGALAGPRALEHLVDTVVTVEGDRHHALRLVRAVKHRFGPTGELGLFEMGDAGLASVADPYRLLLGDRRPGASGSAVLPAVEGQRALLVEVQALTSLTSIGTPARRSAQGVDAGRLGLLVAVLENRAGIPLRQIDVFCSVVGGIRVGEPAADLALALAVASAGSGVPLPPNLVAFGEVGLTGEVRQVPNATRRLAEAARVGFRHAVVPESCPPGPPGMELLHVRSLRQ
ncbi:MAG TPA: DNA repair protein RadA, partial [Acidimicrobiales bacterium]|nr:DNA repair protein RadA [Acidimicrobiales bacterium]